MLNVNLICVKYHTLHTLCCQIMQLTTVVLEILPAVSYSQLYSLFIIDG